MRSGKMRSEIKLRSTAVEPLETRALLTVTVGAMGDSYSDEGAALGIPNWLETLVASGRVDAGPLASFPNGDPRNGGTGDSYTYNFALGGATTESFLGSGFNEQTGSPFVNNRFRQVAGSGVLDFGHLFIGGNDVIQQGIFGGKWLLVDPVTAAAFPDLFPDAIGLWNDITGNYTDGLAYATNNGNHPVQMVLSNYPDLGTIPLTAGLPQAQKDILGQWVDALNLLLVDVMAAQYNAPVIDLHSWWEDVRSAGGSTIYGNYVPASGWFIADGLHPTSIAHAAWSELFVDAVNTRGAGLAPLTEKEMVHYSGLDPNDAPVAHAGGPYSIDAGDGLSLNAGLSSDADTLDTLTYRWDINGDGNYSDATTATPSLSWAQLQTLGIEAGNYNVRVEVSDGFAVNGTTISAPTTLTVNVLTPAEADIGGPYSGDEGTLIALSASGSTGAVLYEWDLDNDGQYDDALGENVNFNATDSGDFTIGLRVNADDGATDSTTVTVNNLAPTASITGTTDIYRGETVSFTLGATDPSPVDQAGLFDFEIDWDGDGSVDETLFAVPSGTTVQHKFSTIAANNIQVRATDKDGATSDISELSVSISPHVLRDDGFGNTDLIWGGTNLLDSVYVIGGGSSVSLFVQFEGLQFVNRLDFFGSAVTGKIILHGYGFSDVLIGEFSTDHVVEIHGGDGDDVIVGGFLGDELFGDGGNDVILGGTQFTDGDDMLFGGQGKDTIFGHLGADTLDGGGGEDLLISDRYGFSNIAQDVQRIGNEWKSGRPYAERVTNILGITSTGVNGTSILGANVTVAEDNAQDVLIGGLGAMDWFFYDFDEDLLGDVIELDEEETDSNP